MALSREEVLHIAILCRIALSEEEIELLRDQLSNILEQFEALKELDTGDVPPTSHSVALASVMREDQAKDPFPKEETLANAPLREGDFFRVHLVLEES
ncbi:MAG: Asp-tRNA(Asn)/Glu-tRNA(Gln) amidotransferase subunit GatC [Chloroflexi bacterium]|nr:Asp-tRNA(Asn)/Glu-tRNA(Gln) amidotransferase subunit GatC [Chloroflexota bacterium]